MRTRDAVLALVLTLSSAGVVAGCSGDDEPAKRADKTPTVKTTDTTIVDCAEFADTSAKITDAQAKLYGTEAAARAAAITTLLDELKALKADAPDKVDRALDDLANGFERAQQVMDDPASADQGELAELAPKLAEASQTLTGYIVEECTS